MQKENIVGTLLALLKLWEEHYVSDQFIWLWLQPFVLLGYVNLITKIRVKHICSTANESSSRGLAVKSKNVKTL